MKLNNEHRRELVRGLASAASLCGLLVGVPILLIVGVGWPLPQGTPSGSEALTAFKTGAIPSSLILKPVSLVVWVLWLQMLAGAGIELWAHFHGRVAPRVSFVPLFMQRLAARLMGTVLIIALSMQHPGTALAENRDLLAPPTLELESEPSWSIESTDESAPVSPHNAAGEAPERDSLVPLPLHHTVERRDSLRMLAERYLGDPDRWTEVFVLNQGQTQADGESLTDPARLQPGWQLVMPADAHIPASPKLSVDKKPGGGRHSEGSVAEREDLLVAVQEGDTLWGLAAHHLDDPERWVEIFDSNQDTIQDPDVILPGWQLEIPTQADKPTAVGPFAPPSPELADPAAYETHPHSETNNPAGGGDRGQDGLAYETHPHSETNNLAAYETHPHSETNNLAAYATHPHSETNNLTMPVAAFTTVKPTVVASIPSSSTDQQPAPSRQTMLAVGGLGVFVSSLGWMLARLRKSQRRRLPSGRIPVPPSQNAVRVDQHLQAAADPDRALFLDASLRVMSSRAAGNPPPDVIGVTLNSDRVSIHLSSPVEAPSGFHSSIDSMTWTLPRDVVLEGLLAEADGVPAPLPALVAVGTRDGNECLLNLEHLVALSLEGDSEAIGDFCAAIATQLASSHLADDLTVICVGFGQDLNVFERVEHVPDVASALERIKHHKRQSLALLGNHPPPVDSRVGSGADLWQPIMTLVPNRLNEEDASLLLGACGSSVCVVAHGLQGAGWLGHFDEDSILVQPIGLRLEAHRVSGAAVAAFGQLASTAKDTEGMKLAAPPPTELQHDSAFEAPLGPDIEVQVMGTVEVVGAVRPFSSRRAQDLVAFLAFHPEGADRDQLKAQIWPPDHPPSNSTLANTVSRARKALGVGDDDKPYLPRVNSKGIYRLRAGIGTDVDRFESLISAARNDPGEGGRKSLEAALELVRGTPFTGATGDMYRWADFGLRTQIECLVDTAAHELARRCVNAGDFQGAGKAAITSLRLVGACELCYRWRLVAAAENPTEVRQIMAELANLLKRESNQSEPGDLLSADLMELYEQLMSGRAVFS